MAIEQKSSASSFATEPSSSVIENELPTYRAISTRAIFSLICGVLSVFCFAHSIFYLTALLAVILGTAAHRAIKRHPDMLTGHGIANAGIALGLIFGLGCGTYSTVQTYVRTNLAEKFAKRYEAVLQANSLADMLFYNLHPEARKDQTGEKLVESLEKATPKDKMQMEQRYSQLLALNKRLKASKDEHVEFVSIESVGEDESHGAELPVMAFALYEIHGPGSKDFPEQKQYALAVFKAKTKDKKYDWWVDDVRFPYKPKSYVPAPKPVDDGHGHAH